MVLDCILTVNSRVITVPVLFDYPPTSQMTVSSLMMLINGRKEGSTWTDLSTEHEALTASICALFRHVRSGRTLDRPVSKGRHTSLR